MMSSYKNFFGGLIVLIFLGGCKTQLIDYVDPQIGTAHSRWFFYTPAAVPYGMAKLAPSTNGHEGNASGWEAVGYDTRHSSIGGFVHFHEWQIGGIAVMPATGPLKLKPGSLDNPAEGYRSSFKKSNEIAEPGYYKVLLDDYGVEAELTATKRVGVHRYTFPSHEDSRLIFDIGSVQGESGEVIEAKIEYADGLITGQVTILPKYVLVFQPGAEVKLYFAAQLDKEFREITAFNNDDIYPDANKAEGPGAGLAFGFSTQKGEEVELKVGLSYTSIANAQENLELETDGRSFDQIRKESRNHWNEQLSKIKVETKKEEDKVKFYTGLYHALLGRGAANDTNGSYPKNDGSVGKIEMVDGQPAYEHMNTDAVWGAFWNITQLWALVYPEKLNDFVNTQLSVYQESGWTGDGLAASLFASGVGTNYVGLVIASAYNSGITGFDKELAYEAVKSNELNYVDRPIGAGKMDLEPFVKKGFIPQSDDNQTDSTGSPFGVSHGLEYSFSTYAAAQMAKALGKTDDYDKFMSLSENWKNYFDPETRMLRPLDKEGQFVEPFDPLEAWKGYQEGNAMQYTYYVPHDVEQLIELIGRDEFNDRLERIFAESEKLNFSGGNTIDAFAGVQSPYNHGNQPSLHISWLFNYSGKPWLTQKYTRKILDGFYGTDPVHGYGFGQDEDQGQLGAWFVMASMGLFDVKGMVDENPQIQLSSPLFDKVTVKLGNGKNLNIITNQDKVPGPYIEEAFFNGVRLEQPWIWRNDLLEGGTLKLKMSTEPNKEW